MVDMKFVPRCTTKIYLRRYQRLYPKYVYLSFQRAVPPERSVCLFSVGGSTDLVPFPPGPLDFVNSGAIYRLTKDSARERAEGGI